MPLLDATRAPPKHYYADNLCTLIRRVLTLYADILQPAELAIANDILGFDLEAQRLIARLVTRKGNFFRRATLDYPEITDVDTTLQSLVRYGFVDFGNREDLQSIVNLFAKPSLVHSFRRVNRGLPKPDFIHAVLETYSPDEIVARLQRIDDWIALNIRETFDLLSFLFFGSRYVDISSFVVRDLGLIQYESYKLSRETRLFSDRPTLDRLLQIHTLHEWLHESREELQINEVDEIVEQTTIRAKNRVVERSRCRLINDLGRFFERKNERSRAIECYRSSTLGDARERLVRLYVKQNRQPHAESLLEKMRWEPWTAVEREFATTFRKRTDENQFARVDEIRVDELDDLPIEQTAITQLEADQSRVWHLENAFPCMLFGLAYWDWIFADVTGAFVNEFQSAPLDLYWDSFLRQREAVCIDPTKATASVSEAILTRYREKQGIANQLVHWNAISYDTLHCIVDSLGEQNIRQLLSVFKQDIRQMSSGFPDLTVIRSSGEVEFIEVKGPTDRLQLNQRIWLRRLNECGIGCAILRIRLNS